MSEPLPSVKAPVWGPRKGWAVLWLTAAALGLGACVTPAARVAPEAVTSITVERADPIAPWRFRTQAAVSSADPRATEAGMAILARGGSATDAAIATMFVLGLVEPQSAGIGGGGFWLNYERMGGEVTFFNGRETAPAATTPDMFFNADGTLPTWVESWLSGLSVGAPGLVPMMAEAHAAHGRLPWAELVGPAVTLAEGGFEITPDLHEFVVRFGERTRIKQLPAARDYFFEEVAGTWTAKPVGTKLLNPAYGATLRRIAAEGPQAMLTGEIAANIAEAVATDPARPGRLTAEDIAAYTPRIDKPVCGPFRTYTVCTSPPPGSGLAVLQILALIEAASPEPLKNDADGWGTFITASQLAYADRDHYVADDAFVPVPVEGLLNRRYLTQRSAGVGPSALASIGPGDPSTVVGGVSLLDRWGRDRAQGTTGTTHLSVVDGQGNAVALTATVEALFGNQMLVNGFFLNNQLTDFAREAEKNGKPLANAAAPLKRPRSSMSPSMVFDAQGNLLLVTGSPGGNNIVAYTAKSIIAVLDMGMTPQEAAATANIIARTNRPRVEKTLADPALVEGLRARGHDVQETEGERSGLHLVGAIPEVGLVTGADPRRGGAGQVAAEAMVPAQ